MYIVVLKDILLKLEKWSGSASKKAIKPWFMSPFGPKITWMASNFPDNNFMVQWFSVVSSDIFCFKEAYNGLTNSLCQNQSISIFICAIKDHW